MVLDSDSWWSVDCIDVDRTVTVVGGTGPSAIDFYKFTDTSGRYRDIDSARTAHMHAVLQ